MVVIFISSAPLNSTACHFATKDIKANNNKLLHNNGNFIDHIIIFELRITSNRKEKGYTR